MRILFLAALIAIIGCNGSKPLMTVEKPVVIRKLNGNWELEMLFASDNSWNKRPYLNLNIEESKFSGNTGCNSISGKLMIKGEQIAFDKNMISTKMACADEQSNKNERSFLAVLLKVNRYTFEGEELDLGQGEIVLMKFRRK